MTSTIVVQTPLKKLDPNPLDFHKSKMKERHLEKKSLLALKISIELYRTTISNNL